MIQMPVLHKAARPYVTRFGALSILKKRICFWQLARIDVWDNFGMQPIHWTTNSTYRWDVTCLAWLLDRGADVNSAVCPATEKFHSFGWTPLHIASEVKTTGSGTEKTL